jgi:hypothetical protein
MHKSVLAILFLFLTTALQAQITFEKVIDTLWAGPATCIQETFDGGYVLTGMTPLNGNDMMILKLDSFCNIEWNKIYGGPTIDFGGYIEQSPDSGYMVNGSYNFSNPGKNWLLRLDVNGDTIWTKQFSAGIGSTLPCENNSMASINNSIYGMTGNYQPPNQFPDVFFQSISSNGVLLSNKIYPTPFSSDARAINKTFEGGFVITGEIGVTSTTNPDIYLIRTNAFGDTIWTKKYHKIQRQLGLDVVQTTDSGFALVCLLRGSTNDQIYLIKTDGAGDTIWTKTYDFNYNPVPRSLQQTDDGGYIITGECLNINFERSVFLIKTNAMGDTLWSRQFKAGGTSVNNFSYYVRQTKDKGYILCGLSTMMPAGLYIIKTDSLGMVYSTTGIPEVNNPFSLNIFPNPNGGEFTLHAKGISKKGAPYKIYNANNQCVYSSDLVNNSDCSLNLSYLPNGLYFIVLYTDNKVFSRKFILEK